MTTLIPSADYHWHWEQPGFDDLAIQKAVEEMVASGRAKFPTWNYPVPGPYNGCTGLERIEGWQRVWLAVRTGLIPSPTTCSVCLAHGKMQYHNEDYTRPLQAKPICPSCHKIIHSRFKNPKGWLQLVARVRRPHHRMWFEDIAMVERDTNGDRRIIETSLRLATKGIRSRNPTKVRVEIRHRTRQR